ncbi:MAG TPA: hypothetical protein VIK29_11945, partial [Paludibacter sp.]
ETKPTETVTEETKPDTTVTEETKPTEVVTKKTKSVETDFKAEAEKLMIAQNLKEIWRCPLTGYWFSRKDHADAQAQKMGKSSEPYKL